jgi:4-aminobutyrate aminotransferase
MVPATGALQAFAPQAPLAPGADSCANIAHRAARCAPFFPHVGKSRAMTAVPRDRYIRTELPGPRARALMARDAMVISPAYPRDYPFVMSHGRGTEVWDVDGNRFLDFAAGIAVCATGHAHPRVVAAVREAAGEFLHISSDYWHERMVALAERLARLAPMSEPAMSFFCQSGTEAVEGAIKLARYLSGRPRFLGFLGGFHGRTMGSLSFTSSKYTQQKGFAPTMPGVTHVPYPNAYRPLFAGEDQGRAVLDYIDMLFERSVPPGEVAAILVEPIQGEGGYIVPPAGFLAGLRELCDRHGILLIFDEVQAGVGRTGRMFACEHEGVQPDIMALAKGLGSGLPIGAVVARRSLMERWPRGAHGNTYGGNPIACAAAIATLDLVEHEYAANAAAMGEYFMRGLHELAGEHDCIGELRGRGLMIGMELVENLGHRTPARNLCDRVIQRAFHNGLLLLACGTSTVRFMPPLSVSAAEIDEAIAILRVSLAEARAGASA